MNPILRQRLGLPVRPDTFEPGPYDTPTTETAIPPPQARLASRYRVGAGVRPGWLDPSSLVPTYVGVVVIAVGFALIGIAWAEIAALSNVALQMPYLVSAGFTGLGLVMVGLIIVNIAAKRQDGATRESQMRTLTETFQGLRRDIDQLSRPDREQP